MKAQFSACSGRRKQSHVALVQNHQPAMFSL
jgi:hypothetical protein